MSPTKIIIATGTFARAVYTHDPDTLTRVLDALSQEHYSDAHETTWGTIDDMLARYPATAPIVASTTMQVELSWEPRITHRGVQAHVKLWKGEVQERLGAELGLTPETVRVWVEEPDDAPAWFYPALAMIFAAAVGHQMLSR